MAVDQLAYKKIEHTIDADFGVEQVFESPFILHDDTAKKLVSYVTQYNLLSNKFLRGYGDSSWSNIRKGNIITITVPRFNITAVTYIVCETNSNFQGKYNFVLRPYDADLYAAVALTPSTAWTPTSGYGNIYEVPYVTVSPTVGEGMFTTIEAALTNFPGWARRIVLMRGTHPAPAVADYYDLSSRGVQIVGESQTEVIVQTKPGYDLFKITDSDQEYVFKDFTVQSMSTGSDAGMMIAAMGTNPVDNSAKVVVDGVIFDLAIPGDVAVWGSAGNESSINITRCRLSGATGSGAAQIYIGNVKHVVISDNIFDESYMGVDIYLGEDISIYANKFLNFALCAVRIQGQVAGTPSYRVFVIGNFIQTGLDATYGVYIDRSQQCHVDQNTINFLDTNVSAARGIYAGNLILCSLTGNVITMNQTDATDYALGIALYETSSGNTISNNRIDLVNNRSTYDIGILLNGASCINNEGTGNVTKNVGAPISDAGSGNSITGNDEGTPF